MGPLAFLLSFFAIPLASSAREFYLLAAHIQSINTQTCMSSFFVVGAAAAAFFCSRRKVSPNEFSHFFIWEYSILGFISFSLYLSVISYCFPIVVAFSSSRSHHAYYSTVCYKQHSSFSYFAQTN